jgi:putative adenylate-forming enzyme
VREPFEIAGAYLQARLRRFASRERLDAYQRRRLALHLERVRRRVPFYRPYRSAAPNDWPIVDRSTVLSHFREMNVAGLGLAAARAAALMAESGGDPELNGLTVGLSSGTSTGPADRGVFLASARERHLWAGTILAKLLPQVWRRNERIALFLRANSALYRSVRSARVRFAYFDLTTPPERQLDALNRFRPTVLVAPPSRLRALAELRDDFASAPTTIIAGAEVLEAIDRRAIRAGFGVDPAEIYQATEGFLGTSCRHGTLHLNEDLMVIEREPVPGGGGRFVPIVTDLYRNTQPVVRYRLDDLLRETSCSCGSPLLPVRVEGRLADTLAFPTSGAPLRLFPDEVHPLVDLPGVEQYAVRQLDPAHLQVALAPLDPALVAGVRRALGQRLGALGHRAPQIAFLPYRSDGGNAKVRRVSRVHPQEVP